MRRKKELMVWAMIVFLSAVLAGCLGGEGKDEIGILGEASSGFDFIESFAKLDTKITFGPPKCLNSTTAEFKFKCSGGALPCKFQYQLDGSGKWIKCKKA